MTVVDVKHLYKSYADVLAVDDLTFSVEPGEILGLIGPNGAGKSSTIKMLMDFLKPDRGEIKILGQAMSDDLKDRIGYLPEERGLYKRLTAMQLITYLASLKGQDKKTTLTRAEELLKMTGMYENRDKKNKEMSKGMGQLIQFIVTVVHDPDLIILDEPFSGLDPVRTASVQSIISGLRDEGKTIILSTHQMNKVEEICDKVLMINRGRTVLYGDVQSSREKFRKHAVRIEAAGLPDKIPGVLEIVSENKHTDLTLAPETTPQEILDHLRNSGIEIIKFEVTTPSLNEIFLELAGVKSE
jgi:ABC-2 type transport system ATP-binding protein